MRLNISYIEYDGKILMIGWNSDVNNFINPPCNDLEILIKMFEDNDEEFHTELGDNPPVVLAILDIDSPILTAIQIKFSNAMYYPKTDGLVCELIIERYKLSRSNVKNTV